MLVNGRFVKFLFNETATTEIYTDLHTLSLPDALPIYRRAAQAALPLPDLVVLVLQGGGALGAYQAGVYEAQIELGIELDWVAGISIGAINAAIIAGNPRDEIGRAHV